MHLKSITLKNFKTHVDTHIDFGVVTSFTGMNASGKTNIIRAIKLMVYAGDWPTKWIRYGQESAKIQITLVNGDTVTRERTRKQQTVTIIKGGKKSTFVGIKDCKDFIIDTLGFVKVILDEQTGPEDLNFINVQDTVYMLDNRPDIVQRKISSLIGTSGIDDARQRLIKRTKKLDSDLATTTKSESNLGTTIARLKPLIKSCLNLQTSIQNVENQRQDLNSELAYIYEKRNHLQKLNSTITRLGDLQKITKNLNKVNTTKTTLTGLQEDQKTFQKLLVISNLPDLVPFSESLSKIKEKETIIKDLVTNQLFLTKSRDELERLQNQLNTTVCPTCGRPLD